MKPMKEQIEIEELTAELIKTNSYGTLNAVAEHLYNAGYRKIIKCKDCADRNTEGCRLAYWDGDKLVSDTEDDGFCCFARAKMKGGAE